MADNRTRVQNHLRSLATSGEVLFREMRYDSHGMAHLMETGRAPASIEVNETGMQVGVDTRYGRSLRRVAFDWKFDLLLAFPVEVSCEDFIESLCGTEQIIPRDTETGQPQITVELKEYEVFHPTRDGSSGTKARFTFDATTERN